MFQFVFGVTAERKAYNGGSYFGHEGFGQGADSVEDAEAKAQAYLSKVYASTFETGRYKLSVRKPCRSCAVTGVKAGCKRKKCPDCEGRGTTDVFESIFTKTV